MGVHIYDWSSRLYINSHLPSQGFHTDSRFSLFIARTASNVGRLMNEFERTRQETIEAVIEVLAPYFSGWEQIKSHITVQTASVTNEI